MAIQASDLAALVVAADTSKKRKTVLNLMSDIQDLIAVRHLAKRPPKQYNGYVREWDALGEQNAAEFVGMFHIQNPTKVQGLERAQAPWRRVRGYAMWDVEEPIMAGGREQIQDVILVEDAKMKQGALETIERAFWGMAGASDT